MKSTYWRIFGFARPVEKFALPYFIYTIIYAIFNTFNFVLVIPVLETLFDSSNGTMHVTSMPPFELNMAYFSKLVNFLAFSIYGNDYGVMDVLLFIASFLVVSCLISNTFRYLGQRTVEGMRIYTLQKIRNTLFDNVLGLHAGYFSNERKGDIISKISSDVQVVQYCIANTLQVVVREPFLIIGYMFAMVKISWQLTIFSVLFLPIAGLAIGAIVKRLRRSAAEAQQEFGNMVSLMDEALAGIKIISGYNAKGYISGKFHEINGRFSRISKSMANRQQMASPVSEFLGITAAAILLLYGGSLVLGGKLGAPAFIAYLAIFTQITRPVRAIADSFSNINQGIAAGERVFSLMDTPSAITDAADTVVLDEFRDSIEFRGVHFSYESREVLKGVSFRINRGETVALVGPSGGGKSTIADLVPRFYDPQQGQILIDGIDIRTVRLDSLRAQMGIVSQETVLFNDSIENNILLGAAGSNNDVETAARVANADGFIRETENGYRTNIGDRGMKLSGGQRQRLSIARAVLKNPPILVLDEATSALDTGSEMLVQQALDMLLEGRTSLVIAHRLSTVRNADRILVVDGGRIVESGTHDELLASDGIYGKLVSMQMKSPYPPLSTD